MHKKINYLISYVNDHIDYLTLFSKLQMNCV